jgi:hypothetical protein
MAPNEDDDARHRKEQSELRNKRKVRFSTPTCSSFLLASEIVARDMVADDKLLTFAGFKDASFRWTKREKPQA